MSWNWDKLKQQQQDQKETPPHGYKTEFGYIVSQVFIALLCLIAGAAVTISSGFLFGIGFFYGAKFIGVL